MHETLLTLHLLAMAVVVGTAVCVAALMIAAARRAPEHAAALSRLAGRVGGGLTLAGLAVLWITGVWMATRAGLWGANRWFDAKLGLVVLLTVGAVFNTWYGARARARDDAPAAAVMGRRLGALLLALAVLTVVSAVLAF